MSERNSVTELDRGVRTIQCRHPGTLHLETGDIDHHEGDAPVQVSLRQSRDTVAVSIARGLPDEDITADTTLFVSPTAARDLATAIREPAQIQLTQSKATMWLRMEWLHHDGPQRSADSFYGTAESSADGSLSMAIHGDGEDNSGLLTLAVTLDDDERAWLADRLDEIAVQAADYEPPTASVEPESGSSGSRWRRVGKTAASLAVSGTVVGVVYHEVSSTLSGQTITFSQPEPAAMVVPFLLVFGYAFLVAAAVGAIPGIPQLPRMGMRVRR